MVEEVSSTNKKRQFDRPIFHVIREKGKNFHSNSHLNLLKFMVIRFRLRYQLLLPPVLILFMVLLSYYFFIIISWHCQEEKLGEKLRPGEESKKYVIILRERIKLFFLSLLLALKNFFLCSAFVSLYIFTPKNPKDNKSSDYLIRWQGKSTQQTFRLFGGKYKKNQIYCFCFTLFTNCYSILYIITSSSRHIVPRLLAHTREKTLRIRDETRTRRRKRKY